jgi:hypothetical protein
MCEVRQPPATYNVGHISRQPCRQLRIRTKTSQRLSTIEVL